MKKILYILLTTTVFAMLSNCKDYNEDEQFPDATNIKFVNVAANNSATSLNYYLNDNKVVDGALYNSFSSYYRIKSGSSNVKINKNNADGEKNLLSIDDNFAIDKSATYFLVNTSASSSDLTYIKSNDDVSQPESQNAKIRLANFAYDLPTNLDVIVAGQVVISNISANSISDFVTIKSGTKVDVVKTGTSTVVKSLSLSNFTSKGVYTVLMSGYNSSTPALNITALSNTQ